MGSNCGTEKTPDIINRCAIPKGGLYDVQGFCTFAGEGGNGYRNQYCSLISNTAEWGNATEGSSCYYNDCNNTNEVSSGCCGACCGIIGEGLRCNRLTFTGDPIQCCFNDLVCSGEPPEFNPPKCYSDGTKRQRTCDDGSGGHNYRSIVSTDCQNSILQYCTGTLPTDDSNSLEWLNRWTRGGNNSCSYALVRNLFRGSNPCLSTVPVPTPGVCNISPPLPIDSEGYFWGQRLILEAMAKYEQQGFSIGSSPGFPGYNTWQDYMYNNVCCPYPGLCSQALDNICINKTAQRISLNPALTQWCGCHLPEPEYQDYSVRYNISPQCTPSCNRSGTIPIVGINGEPTVCKQNICLIDNITLNLINSSIGGDIDLSQICNGCGTTQCSCIVSGTTVDIINSSIGGNVNLISESCSAVTCQQPNPGPTGPSMISVPCGTGTTGSDNPYIEYEARLAAARTEAKKDSWIWTMIAIGIALVIIYFIILLIPVRVT